MVIREAPWPEFDDKNLSAWVTGIRQILKISSRVLVGNAWNLLRYKLSIYSFFMLRKCCKILLNKSGHSLCPILSCYLTAYLYSGLYHVIEGLVFSVQNMKHTDLGTKLTFSKSIPICILALVSIYCYLLTRLLSHLIHEIPSPTFLHSLSLHGPIYKSDCFIFPRMDQ